MRACVSFCGALCANMQRYAKVNINASVMFMLWFWEEREECVFL